MKNNMLNKLKSGYEKLEIKPSSDLWDRLEGKLEEKPKIALKSSFQWWKYAAVIVVLISLGSLFYFNSEKSQAGKIKVTKNRLEIIPKPIEKQDEIIILNENRAENQISPKSDKNDKALNYSFERLAEETKPPKDIGTTEKVNIVQEVPPVIAEKQELNFVKPLSIDQKKMSYISADELLVGRELDKTREENYNDQRKFGVIDMSKIKIKGPNSLKILGITVISDSMKTK